MFFEFINSNSLILDGHELYIGRTNPLCGPYADQSNSLVRADLTPAR